MTSSYTPPKCGQSGNASYTAVVNRPTSGSAAGAGTKTAVPWGACVSGVGLEICTLDPKTTNNALWMPRTCTGSWGCHQDVLLQMFLDEVTKPWAVNKLHTTVL
jgi:hypothetical protein